MADQEDGADRAHMLFEKVSELEGLVAEALRRGTPAKELKEICSDAVQHSRRKALILQHSDSSLLFAAVDQAREEMSKLPEVTMTNADVMRELEFQGGRDKASSRDVSPSLQSVGGSSLLQERSAGFVTRLSQEGGSNEMPPAPQTPASAPPSATHSFHSSRGSSFASPSGGGSSGSLASEVVEPLRHFAAEVAEEASRHSGPSLRSLSMGMKRDKSADLRKSREYDFESARSPTAKYYMTETDFNPFRPARPDCSHYGSGDITTDYMLSSPRAAAALAQQQQQARVGFGEHDVEPGSSEEEEEEGGEGDIPGATAQGQPGATRTAGDGAGAGRAGVTVARVQAPNTGRRGEGAHCAAGVPPGLNPLAVVEGHSDLDNAIAAPSHGCDLPSPGEEEEEDSLHHIEGLEMGSMTPPKHMLARLAEGIKRLSV